MRALTVRQPWAWAIIHGGKNIENRTWQTKHRGDLAIHTAQQVDTAGVAVVAELSEPPLFPWPTDVNPTAVFGAVIGVVALDDVHHADDCWNGKSHCSFWAEPGVFHWEVRPLLTCDPYPIKGMLGLWALPDPFKMTGVVRADA